MSFRHSPATSPARKPSRDNNTKNRIVTSSPAVFRSQLASNAASASGASALGNTVPCQAATGGQPTTNQPLSNLRRTGTAETNEYKTPASSPRRHFGTDTHVPRTGEHQRRSKNQPQPWPNPETAGPTSNAVRPWSPPGLVPQPANTGKRQPTPRSAQPANNNPFRCRTHRPQKPQQRHQRLQRQIRLVAPSTPVSQEQFTLDLGQLPHIQPDRGIHRLTCATTAHDSSPETRA
jgi:hypothetical protein